MKRISELQIDICTSDSLIPKSNISFFTSKTLVNLQPAYTKSSEYFVIENPILNTGFKDFRYTKKNRLTFGMANLFNTQFSLIIH